MIICSSNGQTKNKWRDGVNDFKKVVMNNWRAVIMDREGGREPLKRSGLN
jgi:hypothetical protein